MITIFSKQSDIETVRNLSSQVFTSGMQIPDFVFSSRYKLYRVFEHEHFFGDYFMTMIFGYMKKNGLQSEKIYAVLTTTELDNLVEQNTCIGLRFDSLDEPNTVARAFVDPTDDNSLTGMRLTYDDFVCFPESRQWCIYWCCDLTGIIAVNDVEGWESYWNQTFEFPSTDRDAAEISMLGALFGVEGDESSLGDQEPEESAASPESEILQFNEIIVHPSEGLDSFMEIPHWMSSEDYKRQFLANYGNC